MYLHILHGREESDPAAEDDAPGEGSPGGPPADHVDQAEGHRGPAAGDSQQSGHLPPSSYSARPAATM